jgi:hypothetical protein
MELKCIKGIFTNENAICLVNDVVRVVEVAEGDIEIEGVSGWCKGFFISLSPKEIAECFSYWGE